MTTTTVTFGTSQTWTAPSTLLNGTVSFVVVGARGGSTPITYGGYGGQVTGQLSLAASGTLAVYVGKVGAQISGGTGYSDGGNGTVGTPDIIKSWGGGGSSAIKKSGTVEVVAGGGGGATFRAVTATGQGGKGGPGGGGNPGGNGTIGDAAGGGGGGGGGVGGTGATGGAGGAGTSGDHGSTGSTGENATTGGAGGKGGKGPSDGAGGGGGGGGYAGGGGGGGKGIGIFGASGGGGGGGGSSYVSASVAGAIFTPGVNSTTGLVQIIYTYADKPYIPTPISPANGSAQELAGTPTFMFQYNPGTDSGQLAKWTMRRKVGTGSYHYWSAAAHVWTTSVVWNTGSYLTLVSGTPGATVCVYSYTFPSASWTDGTTYGYGYATAESHYPTINKSTWSTTWIVVAAAKPTVALQAPATAEILNSQSVAVTWTTTTASGDSQTGYRLVLYSQAQYTAATFVPGISASLYDSGVVSGAASSAIITKTQPVPQLASGQTYRLYIQVTETGGVTSTWTHNQFSTVFSGPGQPTLTAAAGATPTTYAPTVTLTAQVLLNQLSAADSSFENDTIESYIGGNADLSVVTTWAADGIYSLQASSNGSATCSIVNQQGTSGMPITAGQTVTAMATVRQSSLTQTMTLRVYWHNAAGTLLSHTTVVSHAATATGFALRGTAVAPVTAAFCAIGVGWTATASAQLTQFDKLGLWYGTVTTWALGGYANASTTVFEFEYRDPTSTTTPTTWFGVRTATAVPVPSSPSKPSATVVDYEAPPGQTRLYRVRAAGQNAVVGGLVPGVWSPSVTASVTTQGAMFIMDPTDPSSAIMGYLTGLWKPKVVEQATRYYPEGSAYSIKSTSGTYGVGGTLPMVTVTSNARRKLLQLLRSVKPLLVQLPTGHVYITLTSTRQGTVTWTQMAVSTFGRAVTTIPYVQTARP